MLEDRSYYDGLIDFAGDIEKVAAMLRVCATERNIEELKADAWRLPVNAADLEQSSADYIPIGGAGNGA
jgi:hypothetical protein